MARVLAGALVAFFAFAGSAFAAATPVGSGTTAWGDSFVLQVTQEKTPGGPVRCLGYEDGEGGGAGCPLTRPAVDTIDVQANASCGRRHVALFGAIDARVARVIVRLVGGRTITATRFDPVPGIDPQMAYWVATFRGFTQVRSITAVAADGSVLARDRDAVDDDCEDEAQSRGRRYEIATLPTADGTGWRLDGYHALLRDDGRLQRTLCFELRPLPGGDPNSLSASSTCGVALEPAARALAVVGDNLGCDVRNNLILYGLARANVGRIVIRSSAGWTVAVPHPAPPKLKAPARVWAAAVHWARSGVVIDAQDRLGRTIAKDRVKPPLLPGTPACAGGSFFGPL